MFHDLLPLLKQSPSLELIWAYGPGDVGRMTARRNFEFAFLQPASQHSAGPSALDAIVSLKFGYRQIAAAALPSLRNIHPIVLRCILGVLKATLVVHFFEHLKIRRAHSAVSDRINSQSQVLVLHPSES